MDQRRLELKPGARVVAADGACGTVEEILADPYTGRVAALVIRPGLLDNTRVTVPFKHVRDSDGGQVRLAISCAHLKSLPAYQPEALRLTESEREAHAVGTARAGDRLGHGNLAIFAGQRVRCPDGYAGRVVRLLLSTAGEPRHLIIRLRGVAGREVVMPVEWVAGIGQQAVQLNVLRQELRRLPAYRADRDIRREVENALASDEALRRGGLDVVAFSVHDGAVSLHGHVPDSSVKARIERAVRGVDGVLAVENELVPDDELLTLVAQALAEVPQLRRQTVSVTVDAGVITLSGQVDHLETRAAAEARVASVPWVRAVVDYLRVPGVPDEADQRVLQPWPGQSVHAIDMPLGRLELVIVDPHTRRISGIAVRGEFPDNAWSRRGMRPHEMSLQSRCVLIASEAIATVGSTGVILDVDALSAARFPDCDRAALVTPPSWWQPPYPYGQADLLLTAEPPHFEIEPDKSRGRRAAEAVR